MSIGPAPLFKHLKNQKYQALLATLREGVAPILANNLLHHFTDHSVSHSDNVAALIDELLEQAKKPLSDQELVILYGACYLHDIGMQYEQAGVTKVISELNLVPLWREQSDSGRRNLLREYHHRISAEIVQASINTADPPIGIQLNSEFNGSYIARLCHAHCISTDTNEYQELVKDGPDIRMSLLSALLRMADILDESRRRATREKARTLSLDLKSQTHWWRHYYTEDVTFDSKNRSITIWFDFPEKQLDEFQRVIPQLQLPWVEAELQRHNSVLLENGCQWSVRKKVESKSYSDTSVMPEEVLTAMLKQLANRQQAQKDAQQLVMLQQFQEARPSVQRRLASLNEREPSMDAGEYLLELSNIAFDLFELGGQKSGVSLVSHRYLKDLAHLQYDDRICIGLKLLEYEVENGNEFQASHLLEKLTPEIDELSATDDRKRRYAKLHIKALNIACDYLGAKSVIEETLKWASESLKASLQADLTEMELLHGNFHHNEV